MAELEIVKAEFYRAVSKISKPIADSTHTISKIAFYVMEITLRNGVKGQGYLLSFHYSPNAIEGALKDICNFLRENEYETDVYKRQVRGSLVFARQITQVFEAALISEGKEIFLK